MGHFFCALIFLFVILELMKLQKKQNLRTRVIFVVGGVMSGIGKGVTVASTARILKSYGFRVTAVKIDPYLNVDAGTMNPTEHGEVFVTHDGMECDQDIGNYERFLEEDIGRINYMTSGSVYKSVIEKERALHYGGKCVEAIPHVTDEIEQRLIHAANAHKADFLLVEVGGTVGETQNALFLEVARMMRLKNPDKVLFMLVSYFPIPKMIGEMKTKPTQHAVRMMNSVGIQPDFIIARASVSLDDVRKQKVSIFCNMHPADIISAPNIESIYEVPVNFENDKLGARLMMKLGMRPRHRQNRDWYALVRRIKTSKDKVRIGIVGKYFGTGDFTLADSYISVIEAIRHSSWALKRKPEIHWLNAQSYERNGSVIKELDTYDGIIVPGGFGSRAVEGKIMAIKYARENNIPLFGLCYGAQLMAIEFARNVCKMGDAHTTEVDSRTRHPVVHTMTDQVGKLKSKDMGGSMRLGSYECVLHPESISRKLYDTTKIFERHRHRYEINNALLGRMQKEGLLVAGINPKRKLVEIIELPGHRFFVGTQFHPEFQSRPLSPHPLFYGFIRTAIRS